MRLKIKITESDVIRVINDYLQIQRNQGKLMYIRNNSGAMPITDGKNKRRFIRFGDKGSPDFLVFTFAENVIKQYVPYKERLISNQPEYIEHKFYYLKTIALEAKSDIGTQSKDQIKWQADFEKIGGEYYVVRCLEELIKIIL